MTRVRPSFFLLCVSMFCNLGGARPIQRRSSLAAAAGQITTFAGNPMQQYSGDGMPASSAQLNYPGGIAFDPATSNLYIADSGNNVIRKVDGKSGLISTIAGNSTPGYSGDGGAAKKATLSFPAGLAFDASHNLLYIADAGNRVVRVMNIVSGIISPFAGTGLAGYSGDGGPAKQATFDSIQAVAFDPSANLLYLSDSHNSVVRVVNVSSGIIAHVAGTGSTGYSGDGGPAARAQLNLLYGNGGLAFQSGKLFIADYWNMVVRMVDVTSGTITTVAGNLSLYNTGDGYSGDGGPATLAAMELPTSLAVDPSSGSLFIVDMGNSLVRKVDGKSGIITTFAGDQNSFGGGYSGDGGPAMSAQFSYPSYIAIDARGSVFVADSGNNAIRRVDSKSGAISTFAGFPTFGYSGDNLPATKAKLSAPSFLAFDASGSNLYIADTSNNVIRLVKRPTGSTDYIITTFAGNSSAGYSGDGGPAKKAMFASPQGMVWDPAGNMFIADTNNCIIRRVDGKTGLITTFAGNFTLGCGYAGDGGPATKAMLALPASVTYANGKLFIADTDNYVIRAVKIATGVITTVAGNGQFGYSGDGGPATSAEMTTPVAVTVDSRSGDLFILDKYNAAIRKMSATSGVITTLAIAGPLSFPQNLVFAAGSLYISNEGSLVMTANVKNGTVDTIAGSDQTGYTGNGGAAVNAELNQPSGIAIDTFGNVFVADSKNNCIRKVYA